MILLLFHISYIDLLVGGNVLNCMYMYIRGNTYTQGWYVHKKKRAIISMYNILGSCLPGSRLIARDKVRVLLILEYLIIRIVILTIINIKSLH